MDPACTLPLIYAYLQTPIFMDESEISSLWCWRTPQPPSPHPEGHLVNADFSLHRLLTSF